MIDLVACRLQRAGLAADESRSTLEGIDLLTRAPLNGALTEQEQALCRMALREAALRLTAWPNQQHAISLISRAYAWMGGEQLLTGRSAG